MVSRRQLIVGSLAGGLTFLSGCSAGAEPGHRNKNLDTYTEGYDKYQQGNGAGSVGGNLLEEDEPEQAAVAFERASLLFDQAAEKFRKVKEGTSDDTISKWADEAESRSKLEMKARKQQAKGNRTKSLSLDRKAAEYTVPDPNELANVSRAK